MTTFDQALAEAIANRLRSNGIDPAAPAADVLDQMQEMDRNNPDWLVDLWRRLMVEWCSNMEHQK